MQEAEKATETPSSWIEKNFIVPDPRDPVTGEVLPLGPIRLADHQRRIIDEALSRDENGKLNYTTIVYSAPKKSGKSAIASAVILYMAYHNPNSYLACVANDGKQANDRLFGPIYTALRLHKQINGALRNENPNIGNVTLSNFTKIEAITSDAAGEAGSQPLVSAFCFDDKTEILTKDGWKTHTDLTSDTIYATINKDSGNFEWQKAKALYRQQYSGEMCSYETSRMSVCVTPNHKFIGRFKGKEVANKEEHIFEIGEALKTIKRGFIQFNQNSWGKFEGNIPDFIVNKKFSFSSRNHLKTHRQPLEVELTDFMELLAWFLSEGCIKYKTKKSGKVVPECVMIGVSKEKYPDNYRRIWDLLERIGLKPKQWKSNDSICFYDMRVTSYFSQFGLSHEKYVPTWVKELPPEYLTVFLDTYYLGDGYVYYKSKDHGFAIGTISQRMAEDLSEIGLKLGFSVTISEYEEKRSEHTAKVIRFANQHKKKYIGTNAESWKKVHYEGYVWCPSTPNGIVFVKRGRSPIYASKNSELWGFETPNKRRLYTELTIPPTLHGRALRWIESYAGYSGISELLEQIYHTGFEVGVPHPDFMDLIGRNGPVVRVNERAGMFVYWDTEARMPWQTPDYYAEQSETLPPNEFRRIHGNEWVSPLESFIQETWWDACIDENLLPLVDSSTPVVVGIDMAVTRDCAALVAVTRHPDAPDTKIAVRAVRIFSPKDLGGIIQQETMIRPVIEDWAKRWNVVCWVYDPREMSKLAQDLTREGVGWFKAFGQQQPRAVSDKALHDMIVNRQIAWNPATTEGDVGYKGSINENLYRHLTLAGANTRGDTYRLEKLSNNAKIDGAVALSQAAHTAMQLAIGNRERDIDHLVDRLRRGLISQEEFSKQIRKTNPALEKRAEHGNR